MAVRVKVRIALGGHSVQVVAIANTGFETDDAQLLLPVAIGKHLRGTRASKATPIRYATAGGMGLSLVPIGIGSVRALVPDRQTPAVDARILVSQDETEIVMNDVLVEALGLVLLKPGHGIWRFLDDAQDRERPSEPRTTY